MKRILFILFSFFPFLLTGQLSKGFFDYEVVNDAIHLHVQKSDLNKEFLYVNYLSTGLGSNDIGLDRGQIGNSRIVKFEKAGNKILLIEPNYDYRALSENKAERLAVEEAFASSVLFGFEIKENLGSSYTVVLDPFLIQDSHQIQQRLKNQNQGSFKLDKSRSAVWMDKTKNFPKNSEFEALITFVGNATGQWLRSVSPSSNSFSVRVHHSFVELPDDNFKPRRFHPYSGYGMVSFYDYASPISSPLEKKYIRRHRLNKKDPSADISEAVEPIVYYIDAGCPEPIKSALMDGAKWWDQAFQAAGYAPNTFQIKELPEGADMLDIRYNVIQWVHRSTRGWSYGMSVVDPRTGEIIKGHVSLGSLRVRQDYLIASGLRSLFDSEEKDINQVLVDVALARLRQLSAHEVGHTLGLAHNFAASVNSRSSVMDYPHPLFTLNEKNKIDIENIYDDKIGNWDKKTIAFGYQDFPEQANENEELEKMIYNTQKEGYLYISDRDARPQGGAHPLAHLWDNGTSAVQEMERILSLRKMALEQFGIDNISEGMPLSELEKALVPLYLMHRYQAEAVVKWIGGFLYHYNTKGDFYADELKMISNDQQEEAINVLLKSITPEQLKLPLKIKKLLHPSAMGFYRDRETFSGKTNIAFDVFQPAEGYVNFVMSLLLNKDRLTRIDRQNKALNHSLQLDNYLKTIVLEVFSDSKYSPEDKGLNDLCKVSFINQVLVLLADNSTDESVRATLFGILHQIKGSVLQGNDYVHAYLRNKIDDFKTGKLKISKQKVSKLPPGSPIGCHGIHH